MTEMNDLLAKRKHHPEQLSHALNIISLTENPTIVGSAKYVAHKYPGDIDVFEYVVSESNKEKALYEFAFLISNVVKMIAVDSSIQMTDFKAGEDLRYKFTTKNIREHIASLKAKKLLTNAEVKKLSSMSDEEAIEYIRNLTVVKWKITEVILGEKELRNNKKIKLEEALGMNAVVKLDTVTWFSSRLQSVEILYLLAYTEDGQEIPFYEMGNYKETVIKDIEKYKLKNPLKTLKRLWGLSVYVECDSLIEELEEVFSSDAAALNQIVADIETLKKLEEPIDQMILVALEFKKRLFDHLTADEFHSQVGKELHCKCDDIFRLWIMYRKYDTFDYPLFHKHLDELDSKLKPLINQKARLFYDKIKNDNRYCFDLEELL